MQNIIIALLVSGLGSENYDTREYTQKIAIHANNIFDIRDILKEIIESTKDLEIKNRAKHIHISFDPLYPLFSANNLPDVIFYEDKISAEYQKVFDEYYQIREEYNYGPQFFYIRKYVRIPNKYKDVHPTIVLVQELDKAKIHHLTIKYKVVNMYIWSLQEPNYMPSPYSNYKRTFKKWFLWN